MYACVLSMYVCVCVCVVRGGALTVLQILWRRYGVRRLCMRVFVCVYVCMYMCVCVMYIHTNVCLYQTNIHIKNKKNTYSDFHNDCLFF